MLFSLGIFAYAEDLPLFEKKTFFVLPNTVSSSEWENLEALQSQDYSEDAIYQDFGSAGSAFIPKKAKPRSSGTGSEEGTTPRPPISEPLPETDTSTDLEEGTISPEGENEGDPSLVPENEAEEAAPESEDAEIPVEAVPEETAEPEPPLETPAEATEDDASRTSFLTLPHRAGIALSSFVSGTIGLLPLAVETYSGTDPTTATDTESFVDEHASPVSPDLVGGEYRLEFSGFSVPPLGDDEEIENAQIRLSMASKPLKATDGILHITYALDDNDDWIEAGVVLLSEEVSNALNGGYFLFALPQVASVEEMAALQVRMTLEGDPAAFDGLYVDSLWLEFHTLIIDEETLRSRTEVDSLALLKPQIHDFIGTEVDFSSSEMPHFVLKYHEQRNAVVQFFRGLFADRIAEIKHVAVRHVSAGELDLHPDINMTEDGLWTIRFRESERRLLRPGRYTLEIEVGEGDAVFTDALEFQWGLLAINSTKSEYRVGESVALSFAALSENGNTVCDAQLDVYVIRPDHTVEIVPVAPSGVCSGNNVVNVPDYSSVYNTSMVGAHTMYVERIALDGTVMGHAEDIFNVASSTPIALERSGPTRIYPVATYPMAITISSRDSFSGTLIEKLPADFAVSETDATTTVKDGMLELSWSLTMGADTSQTFSYAFNAPDISPYLFFAGAASVLVDESTYEEFPEAETVTSESEAGDEADAPTETETPDVTDDSIASSTEIQPEPDNEPYADEVAPEETPVEEPQETPEEVPAADETEAPPDVEEPAPESGTVEPVSLVPTVEALVQENITIEEPVANSSTEAVIEPEAATEEEPSLLETILSVPGTVVNLIVDQFSGDDTNTNTSTADVPVDVPETESEPVSKRASTSPHSFTEYRSWQIASDATGNMLLYWDGTSVPSGWTCVSCHATTSFYARMVLGSSTAGLNGGAATSSHSATGTVSASAASVSVNGGGNATPVVAHTHTFAAPTISTDTVLPPYRQLALMQYNNAGEPPLIPAGAIAVFDAAVPSGWTRYSAQDGRYILPTSTASIGTTGGALTHTHTMSGTTGAAASTVNLANGDGLASAGAAAHTHTISSSTGAVSNEPPYIETVIGKLNATSSATDAMIAMWTDTPPTGWNTVSSSTEPFSNRFAKASTTYGGTGGTFTHSHVQVSGITSSAPSGTVSRDSAPITTTVTTGAHTHAVSVGGFSIGTNTPPYRTAIFAKRNGGAIPIAPTLHDVLFESERTGTSTPYFEFTGSDSDGSTTLIYQFQWDDDANLDDSPIGDRTSDNETGCSPNCFTNTVSGGDTSPFNDGEKIRFTMQTALTSGTTYYWRVRVKELVGDTYSPWSAVTSFTYQGGVDPSQWYQTHGSQFDTGTLANMATTADSVELSDAAPGEALVAYGEGVVQTPRYRFWSGTSTSWTSERSANNVGGTIEWVRTAAGSTRDEYILATQDASADVNVQVYSATSSAWNTVVQVTGAVSDITRRGFDVAYETSSGDALIVYCDGDSDPSYRVWNGQNWATSQPIVTTSANNCDYISLASDPNSDEIIMVERDTGAGYEAQVWDGSAWANPQTLGSMTDTDHEGIAVEYEESGDQALIVTSNANAASFAWAAWSGTGWSTPTTQGLGNDFEWGVLKRDEGSDNMVLCYIDQSADIGMVRWNGLSWNTFQEFEISGNDFDGRAVSCEFETAGLNDGYIMAAYSSTTVAGYQEWDGGSFSGNASLSTVLDSWEVGTVRTGDDKILAYFHDDANTDYSFSYWDGSTWSASTTLETSPSVTSAPRKQPIGMVAKTYQASTGNILSDPIDFDWVPNQLTWGELSWNTTEPAGTNIGVQVYFGATCSSLVPDGVLAGNSSSFDVTASPLNISGLSTSTYNQLCIKAVASSTNSSIPSLDDWTISWERQPYLVQSAYLWYVNESALPPTDPWPAGATNLGENDPITDGDSPPGLGSAVRLRMGVRSQNIALSTSSLAFKLQYASGENCASSTTWYDVGAIGSTTAAWRGKDTSGLSDGATISSTVLSASDVGESYEEENNSASNPSTIGVNNDGEWDWALEHNGLDATQYCFRMINSGGEEFGSYEQVPTLLTNASPNVPTLVSLFDNEKATSTTPYFTFHTSDTESNELTYQVQIDDDYNFASVDVDRNTASHGTQFENLATPSDKDPFTAGETIRFHNTTALSNGTTYYWRVRAQDPSGSNAWGDWSTRWSFTIDTSLTASAWFQTSDAQFITNTFDNTATSGAETTVLAAGQTIGTSTTGSIDFDWKTVGNAWGSLTFTDTEASSDLKYTVEYFADDTWSPIPDSDLAGNGAGFDASPVSLLELDTDTYNVIRVAAIFTDSGASPILSDWTINWDFKILAPTIDILFPSERQASTTPIFRFTTSDPQSDDLLYQVQWSTSSTFAASTTRTSDTDAGFSNASSTIDTSPFTSGNPVEFHIQTADAISIATTSTYWFRARAKDPAGANSYSAYSDLQSFTVHSTTTVSTWFQTTSEQFLTDTLTGATTTVLEVATVATTAVESLIGFAAGTEQTPKYRLWNGSSWATEQDALTVDSAITWTTVKAGNTREEYLMGTLGTDGDVNVQVYQNGAWGDMQEMATSVPNTSARAFDITYESTSGKAMVVSCDGDADPIYYTWNGTAWTLGGTVNLASTGNCAWVRLMSSPSTNEIILMARDSTGSRYEMAVWNATTTTWGNITDLGSMNEAGHEGVAGSYEYSGNQGVVTASDGTNNDFVWKAWSGSAWTATATVALGDDFEAGTLAADVGSDNMVLCYVDQDNDIGAVRWTGAGFVATVELETLWAAGSTVKNDRPIDCAFEVGGSRDGFIMAAYSDTANLRYQYWDTGLAAWQPEGSISTIEDSARVQMRRTSNNLLQVVTYDIGNDRYDYSYWDASSWSNFQSLETDGVSGGYPYKEPFMIAPRNPGTTGTVVGNPGIVFGRGDGPYWQSFAWVDSEPGGSSILYQIEYYNTASSTWDLVPDSLIPGNSSGTTTSPLSLTAVLPVTTYSELRPVANMSCNLGTCPTLSDWTLTWAAGITVSGTAKQYDQSSNVTSGTVAIAKNGVLQAGKTGAISGGTWSIVNVNAREGDVLTVFVQGAATTARAVAVGVYDGVGDVDGIELIERHLSLGSNDNATTTNAYIGLYDNSNTSDIFANVDAGNDLSVCAIGGCADAELYIKRSNSYQPGPDADVTTHDIENNGTFLPDGNTIRVSGSWDNNATATMATSSLIFTSTSTTESFDDTGATSTPTYYNVTFGETSGTATWNASSSLDVDSVLTVAFGTLARNTKAITVAGNLSTGANGLWTGATSATTTFDGSIAATWTDSAGTKQNIGNAVVNGTSKTVTLASSVRAQSITIGADDILDSGSTYDLTVDRNWSNSNTFLARTGRVIFAATSSGAVIDAGASSFYDLTFNGANGAWSFAQASLTVGNDMTMSTGTVTLPTGTTTVTGSWNSAGGLFAHNNGGILFNSSAAESVVASGTTFTNAFYNLAFSGSGSWNMLDTNATTSNNLYLTAGTVTFPSGIFAIGGSLQRTSGAFTATSGLTQFTSGSAQTIQTGGSSFYGLRFTGSGSWTFSDTNVTVSGDTLISAGAVTAPSGTLTLAGSFTNVATFTHNSGTVLLSATTTGKTINPGSSSFYNLTASSTAGGWTISANATTTNAFSLNSAMSFTLSPNIYLSVGGIFTNTANNASTTWTNSHLALISHTAYAVNGKGNPGDDYATVILATSTQISSWYSSYSTTTLATSSSVYSQDNANVNGNLYIYGTYQRTSGTEYWSHATDFDGTSLAGGSERQANVRFSATSSATFATSTLNVTGTTTATTTIASLAGTYQISVLAGTTTASYYSFANLGPTGLTLATSTKVTSLSDGSFSTGLSASTTIRVDVSTVDANPALQIQRVQFATSSLVSAFNVTQYNGTPASYWWFRNSYGNISGEAFDSDTGDPGSIRWDDSSLLLTISGVAYSDEALTPLGGPTCDGVTQNIRLVVASTTAYNTSCNATSSAYSIPNVVVVGDQVITAYLNTDGGVRATTISKTLTASTTGFDLYANRIITRHEDVSPLTIADMAAFDEAQDSDIRFDAATGTTNTLTVRSNTELHIGSSTTFAPGGTVTLTSGGTGTTYDGTLHLDNGSTFTGVGTTTYSVGGRFAVDTGATFTSASSTVVMTATTTGKNITTPSPQSITFNNLQLTGVGGGWSVDGDIIVNGLMDVATGTVSGTEDITLENDSISGAGTVAMTGGTATVKKNNTLGGARPWTFYNLTLGDGSTIGTTTPAGTATTTVRGVLTIRAGHTLDGNSSQWDLSGGGTPFVNSGIFLYDTTTFRYSSTTATNVTGTSYYHLDLNASGGSPTYTATGAAVQVYGDLTVGGVANTTVDFNTSDPALPVAGSVYIRSNGTLSASNSGSFTIAGSYDNDGTFTGNSGTVSFTGSGASTIAAGNSSFGSLTVNGSGTFTVSESATATSAFNLAAAGSFTLASGSSLAVQGTFTNSVGGAATTWTGTQLALGGGGNYQINASTTNDQYATLIVAANTDIRMWNSNAPTIVVDPTGSLYSQDHNAADGSLYIYGDYFKSSGADYWSYATDFDGTALGAGSRVVTVAFAPFATATVMGGTLHIVGGSAASTTVTNQGSGTYALIVNAGTLNAQYYVARNMNIDGWVFTSAPTITNLSNGDYQVGVLNGSAITVGGTVINQNPAKTWTGNIFATSSGISAAFNVTATGTSISSWRFTNHAGAIDGEAFDVDPDGDPGYVVWDDSAGTVTISGNVYSDEGSTPIGAPTCNGASTTVHLRVQGLTDYSTTCNAGTGFYSIPNVSFSPGDTLTLYLDTDGGAQAANVTADPISSIGNMNLYQNRVIVRHEDTSPITIADMSIWDSSDDADIPFTAVDGSPDTLTLPANRKLIVWDNKTFAPGGDMTLSGGGAGASYDGTLELYANATFGAAGTESHSIGGSYISGAGATTTGASATFTFTTTGAARTVDLNEGTLYNMTFNGSGSWTITDTNLFIGNNFTITLGSTTMPSGTTTVAGSFQNIGGSFTHNSGVLYFISTAAGKTVQVGTSSVYYMHYNGSGGTWSMSSAHATSTTGFLIDAGTVTLPSGVFAVGGPFDNVGGSFTHNSGTVKLLGASASTTLRGRSSNFSSVHMAGNGSYIMQDSSLTLANNLTISQGALTLATGTLSVGGSFLATGGTFDHASGTILFNATAIGKTVDAATSTFNNVSFASASGGWTMATSATTTGNFSLTAASSFTMSSGTRLTVYGVFTNTVGPTSTTWHGSTIDLKSASNYTINTRTDNGDSYQTLIIGADTDIRMWDSQATTTQVASSSSLYSEDHNGVGGRLYIYGDYGRTSGSDYWSYATDFDGTALTASRQVNVFFAANATGTWSGATLEMVGAVGASTTVTNQGSGTYALTVDNSTINASKYQLRNADADGLNLTGLNTVTSLSGGDFELAVAGGSLITVSSTTVNANASLSITGTRFATTTAITGTNVELSGTTPNIWTFSTYTGNLSGEAFDIDGGDACGSIRWTDSTCLITQQTHYRWRNDDGGEGVPNSEWYNASWSKRKRVVLTNADSVGYVDAAVKMVVTYDSDMQGDFDDLRFTDSTGLTELPYWRETYAASGSSTVWVKVPLLATSTATNIYMYYGNAGSSDGSSGTTTFSTFDAFEDGNITEYSGDTSQFSAGNTSAYERTYRLNAADVNGRTTDGIYNTTSATTSQGKTLRFLQYIDTSAGSGDETCTLFGVQTPGSANQNYAVCLEQFGVDRVSISKNVYDNDTNGTVLASSTITYSTGWYEVEVKWSTSNSIAAYVYRGNTLVASTSVSDSSYTTGGMGFTYWFQHGAWDIYSVRPLLTTEPSVSFSVEQVSGGATWYAAIDTAASGIGTDVTKRLRFVIENTGLAVTNQQIRLEYASKGASPSCAAVAYGSYAQVPPQASCGLSPLCMKSSTQFTDQASTTDHLLGSGTFTYGQIIEDPSNKTANLDIDSSSFTEVEYAIAPTVNANASNYCFRVTNNGSDFDAYTTVAELGLLFNPIVLSWSFNDSQSITLTPGTTTRVYATGTVSDSNGYDDLQYATSTFYRSGVGPNCSANNNDCYQLASTSCTLSGCSGNSCNVSCSADILYFADPTDAGTYVAQDWRGDLLIADQTGGADTQSTIGSEMGTLRALDVTTAINYGAVSANADTGGANATTTVQNAGNDAIDVNLSGTDLTSGPSTIGVANEKYATSTFTYSSCVICGTLSSGGSDFEIDLAKPTTTAPSVYDEIYWGIAIPYGTAAVAHEGMATFMAIGD